MKSLKICLVILCLLPVRAVGTPQFSGANLFMKEIKVISPTHGDHFALVDDGDFLETSKYKWFITVCNGRKYPATKYKKGQITMHRFIMRSEKGQIVDHIDSDSFNNQRGNLRHCTQQQNLRNSRIRSDNTTGYKGVSYFKRTKKYIAYITIDGVNKHLGYFKDVISAARAYNEAAMQHFGEFSRFNEL